jgi:hypothetical protein
MKVTAIGSQHFVHNFYHIQNHFPLLLFCEIQLFIFAANSAATEASQ